MRYQRQLDQKQIRYLIKNSHLSNIELAKKLNTTPTTIANYKYRARKNGIEIPKNKMPKMDSNTNFIKRLAKKEKQK
jgi:DNA-binding Lrp family transcriptional regulator